MLERLEPDPPFTVGDRGGDMNRPPEESFLPIERHMSFKRALSQNEIHSVRTKNIKIEDLKMAQPMEPYIEIAVETYLDHRTKKIRVRPVAGEMYPQTMAVECARSVRYQHPVGTRFRISAKLTDRDGGGQFLYSHHSWSMTVLP